MSVSEESGTEAQHRLVERWVALLAQLPAVEVIWLEGSLVDDRANPWSDIDPRVAVTDQGCKELNEIFPAEFLQDLQGTYTLPGQAALDPAAIAAAQVRTFTALGKHLAALSDQVGGGFEPEWYPRFLTRLTRDLGRLVGRELDPAS